ncbi:hypothetical protein D9613_011805 [Agrocybe pediades]|uniref:Vegetative incompatibility protein HET-E-1 n=1 Tax=Agrocybe pediades TaxID=84607 RepID=A0A8H4QKM6_9AGAR|nr:hypothetical protein D9613_011805 [Agrocybe pediades]
MEVLNVKRHMTTGPKLLVNALSWLKVSFFRPLNKDGSLKSGHKENSCESKNTQKKLYDAREFVEAFSMGACSKSTPHIYISALPFFYKSNFVYENYWTKTRGLITVDGSSVKEKNSRPIATWKMDYWVESIAFSHDGATFATGSTGSRDGVRIHDADSGEILAGPFIGASRPRPFSCDAIVTFSPDNTHLASVCHDTICIWNVQTGNLIGPLREPTEFITSLSFSPDSKKLVSGAYDGAIIVWNAATGDIISGPFRSTGDVKTVGFTPDGFKIVSVSDECRICIWDADKGAILSGPFEADGNKHGNLSSAALSSDRSTVAICFSSGAILIVNAFTGAVICGPFVCNESAGALVLSHDGKKVFSRHTSGFRVWDTQNGTLETHLVSNDSPNCFAVAPTSKGNKIMSSSRYDIHVWNTTDDNGVVTDSPSAHGSIQGRVSSLAYSPDGCVIAAGFFNGFVCLWDAHTGEEILRPFQAHKRNGDIYICFSPDGANFVTALAPRFYISNNLGPVRLWDARTGKMIRELAVRPSEQLGPVNALAYSHGGSLIAWSVHHSNASPAASLSLTPSLSLCSQEEYEEIDEDDDDKEEGTEVPNVPADTIMIWDLRSGRIIGKLMQEHIGDKISVAFSPDDTILVSGTRNELAMWSVDGCKVIWQARLEPAGASVRSMAFSPDGTRFASGSSDGQLRLWKTTTSETIPLPWRGRSQHTVTSIVFLSDGKKVLTVSSDSAIHLWDAETGDILGKFNALPTFKCVAVSPDCSRLAASIYDADFEANPIRMWEVENALATVQAMAEEDIRSGFDNEDRIDSTFYSSPQSVKLAMSRIANYHNDGWVKVDDRNIFWTSPDFRANLCHAYNPLVIGPYGTTLMDYSSMNLCIGKKWVNCWLGH